MISFDLKSVWPKPFLYEHAFAQTVNWGYNPEKEKVNMPLHVEISSFLRKYVPDYDPVKGLSLNGQAGRTVGAVMNDLGIPLDEVQIILVNHRAAKPETRLGEDDEIGLFPALGGG